MIREYERSVARLRQWSMSNPALQNAIDRHGTAEFGPWLLLDGSWLGGGPTHHDVGHVHEFMTETGSVRVYRRGTYLAIEMTGPPTVDQMREINHIAQDAEQLEVDLIRFDGAVRQLGNCLVEDPNSKVSMSELWRWIDGVFEWQI